jgi:Big-like domain-containing protein/PKD domain-containing protein
MLSVFMIARTPRALLAFSLTALLVSFAASCQRVPLLAPSGSTITLTTTATALPINGTADLIAQVIEAAGTPPHSGTHVSFTTSLGTIEPSEAETDINGRAQVKFNAGNISGVATITASSGNAQGPAASSSSSGSSSSTTTTGSSRTIAIGTAAVGRITLSANPSTISSNGGSSTILANVVDINGNPLAKVSVAFSTSAGVLSTAAADTDANGLAQSTLTTSVEATVTATAGVPAASSGGGSGGGGSGGGSTSSATSATVTVKVNPLPTVSIAAPTGTLTAGSPVTFTLVAMPGTNSTAQIRDVTVDFGDGDVRDLGAVTTGASGQPIQHQYNNAAPTSYTVRATVLDTLGGTTTAATVIVVLGQPPLSVTLTSTQSTSGTTTFVTFTATVTPNTATIASYLWNFGDGSSPQLTTGPQVPHNYVAGSGPKTVTVTATTTSGQTATTSIIVTP